MKANQRKLIAAMSLCAIVAVPNIASAISVSGQGTWESTLQGRDLDGNLATAEAYYDTVLNITWLADASAIAGSAYDDVASSDGDLGTTTDGLVTGRSANSWAASLDFNGVTGWRMPESSPINGSTMYNHLVPCCDGTGDVGYNISAPGTLYAGSTAHEAAHMFYNTLGNKASRDTSGQYQDQGVINTGPFSNILHLAYWVTQPLPDTYIGTRLVFDFQIGFEYEAGPSGSPGSYAAWAVHDGDVGASVVPVPAAAWLFGSGLIGLIGVARRKAA